MTASRIGLNWLLLCFGTFLVFFLMCMKIFTEMVACFYKENFRNKYKKLHICVDNALERLQLLSIKKATK